MTSLIAWLTSLRWQTVCVLVLLPVALVWTLAACQRHAEQNLIADDDSAADDDTQADDDDDDTNTDDADGDGYTVADGDCNDGDEDVHPGADEACDDTDWDCDGDLAEGCASCLEVQAADASAATGAYTIDPDGSGGEDPIETKCQMSKDGGGWTLLMRTTDDWDETQALITDYDDFYALTSGSWNAEYRMAGKLWASVDDQHEHLFEVYLRLEAGGSCDPLWYKATGGVLSFPASGPGEISGVSQPATLFASDGFSTTDSGDSTICVTNRDAVPWFHDNCCSLCPTYGVSWDPPSPMVTFANSTADMDGNVTDDVCSGDVDTIASGAPGATSIAYYVR